MSEPAYVRGERPFVVLATQSHAPGWSASTRSVRGQHVAVDAALAEAVGTAHRARHALRLPRALATRIAARVHAAAMGPFHRFPSIRLNQFNWHADLYAQDAHSSGDPRLLHGDYRRQLRRFVHHVRTPVAGGGTYLNAGLGLNYVPAFGPDRSHSSEYANLVLSGLIHYDGAVVRGMARLPAEEEAVLRAWRERVLYGDWTHAGYLNWDSHLGFRRWHLTRYWALSGYGLLTLAGPGRLAGRPERGYAKWLLDRYFERYARWAKRAGGLLGSTSFGMPTLRAHLVSDPALVASRFQAHAARAAFLGLGRVGREGQAPPPYFAHDPDIRRVAISTPRYSTALVQADRTTRLLEEGRWRPLPAGGQAVASTAVLALRGPRAAYAASLVGLPAGARVERVAVAPPLASPHTRTVIRVTFPLGPGATVTTTARLSRIG